MKTTKQVQAQIDALKEKVNIIKAELENEIYEICEQLDYVDSSVFSYNIDNLKRFSNNLNEFKIK